MQRREIIQYSTGLAGGGIIGGILGGLGGWFKGKDDGEQEATNQLKSGWGFRVVNQYSVDGELGLGESSAKQIGAESDSIEKLIRVDFDADPKLDVLVLWGPAFDSYQEHKDRGQPVEGAAINAAGGSFETQVDSGRYHVVFDNTRFGSQPRDVSISVQATITEMHRSRPP